MVLENSQDLPEGYGVWADAIEGGVYDFYATEEGQQGRAIIEPEADAVWTSRGEFQRALNKKKIRKTITPFEEFWATVAYSILENLQYVSLGRFVKGESGEPFLERLFQIYICGLYPCGLHDDGRIVALDPASLAGFEKLPEGVLSR